MKLWKVLGLAGLAGVAATGAIIVREHRQRTQLEPDEIRARLHARLADASDDGGGPSGSSVSDRSDTATGPRRFRRWFRRD